MKHLLKFTLISLFALVPNLALLPTLSLAASQVIGYVDSSQFHPLIVLDGKHINVANSVQLELTGKIMDAFEEKGHVAASEKQITELDAYTDEQVRFGLIAPVVREKDRFYVLNSSPLNKAVILEKNHVIKSFYKHFSKDNWGRHFVENLDWLKLPLNQLYENSSVWTHYVTDLDDDGLLELWMTYKLMWGEVGRMVFEQSETGSSWIRISNHCFNCD